VLVDRSSGRIFKFQAEESRFFNSFKILQDILFNSSRFYDFIQFIQGGHIQNFEFNNFYLNFKMSEDSARQQLRQRRLRLQRQRQEGRISETPPATNTSSSRSRHVDSSLSSSRLRSNISSKVTEDTDEQDVDPVLIVPKIPGSILNKRSQSHRSPSKYSRSSDDDTSTSQYETKYSPPRDSNVRHSWNSKEVGQKSQAPSPSETQMWRSDLSSSKLEESIDIFNQEKREAVEVEEEEEEEEVNRHDENQFDGSIGTKEEENEINKVEDDTNKVIQENKEEDQENQEEDEEQQENDFYLDGQLDDLDVSGVCDTPVADRDLEESDSGSNSDTDEEHDIESSPSNGYGLRRQDLEQHESKNQEKADPLASLLDLLEKTDAESSATNTSHQLNTHDWEDTESIVSGTSAVPSIARSLAAPSYSGSMASSVFTNGGPMSKAYNDMKLKLTGLTMEVEDKTKTLKMLKKILREARQSHRDAEEELASREAKKLKQVRSEYESTIARHLGFIDRLLADKQSLSDKCDALAEEMKRIEKRYAARALDMQENHISELKRQKEALAAGERARRERWTNEKKREIKESTLKGLEPELQRILSKHKNELRLMEDGHLKQLRNVEIKMEKERDDSLRRLREKMDSERDEAVNAEIDISRSKLREQSKKYESELNALRDRYEKDHYSRTERDESMMKKMSERHSIELEKVRVMERERREDQARRFTDEKNSLIRLHEDNIVNFKRREEEERNEYKDKLIKKYNDEQKVKMEEMKSIMVSIYTSLPPPSPFNFFKK
jgi:hypothetical protein